MKTILLTFLFFWASLDLSSQKTTNFVFCVHDSSDYDFQKLSEQLNNKHLLTAKNYVFCYINDDKLNHIYINPNNKDTLSKLNSSYTNTSTYNKDLLFEFMLIFEDHLNAEDASKINLFLLLHTNNLAKYLPLKTTDVIYSDRPKTCVLSSVKFSTKTLIVLFFNDSFIFI